MMLNHRLGWLLCILVVLANQRSGFGQDPLAALAGDFVAMDTLAITPDASAEAQDCLDDLGWEPVRFQVHVETQTERPPPPNCVYVRFPSPKPSGNEQVDLVNCEWYVAMEADSVRPAVRRAVIVVHESGSSMVVGRLIASELCRRGLHAFLVQLPGYGARKSADFSSDDLIKVFAQGIADVRRARDAVAVLANVDASHIALQGTSLGGFVATLANSLDGKFDSTFLLLCGGDLHGVLTTGNHDARKTLERLHASGLAGEPLRQALRTVEPLRLAHRLPPETTWLFSGSFDQVVPPKHARLLVDAAQLVPDHHVQMLATHYSGIIYLPAVMTKMSEVVNRP